MSINYPTKEEIHQNRMILLLLFLTSLFDALTTHLSLSLGANELNGVYSVTFGTSIILFYFLRLFLVPFLIFFFYSYLFQKHRDVSLFSVTIPATVWIIAGIHNLYIAFSLA